MNCRNSLSDVSTLIHPDDDLSYKVNIFAGVGDEESCLGGISVYDAF